MVDAELRPGKKDVLGKDETNSREPCIPKRTVDEHDPHPGGNTEGTRDAFEYRQSLTARTKPADQRARSRRVLLDGIYRTYSIGDDRVRHFEYFNILVRSR